jgi:hypothetical protein
MSTLLDRQVAAGSRDRLPWGEAAGRWSPVSPIGQGAVAAVRPGRGVSAG